MLSSRNRTGRSFRVTATQKKPPRVGPSSAQQRPRAHTQLFSHDTTPSLRHSARLSLGPRAAQGKFAKLLNRPRSHRQLCSTTHNIDTLSTTTPPPPPLSLSASTLKASQPQGGSPGGLHHPLGGSPRDFNQPNITIHTSSQDPNTHTPISNRSTRHITHKHSHTPPTLTRRYLMLPRPPKGTGHTLHTRTKSRISRCARLITLALTTLLTLCLPHLPHLIHRDSECNTQASSSPLKPSKAKQPPHCPTRTPAPPPPHRGRLRHLP